jgi:hypothetical protein
VIGLVAGWLAGLILNGSGYGLARDLVIGVIGAFLGGFVAGQLASASSPVSYSRWQHRGLDDRVTLALTGFSLQKETQG